MTGGATRLLHLEQNRITVAIDKDLPHALDVATLLPLLPDARATAAVINGFAGGKRSLPGLEIHVRQHENLAGGRVLGNHRQEAVVRIEGWEFAHW